VSSEALSEALLVKYEKCRKKSRSDTIQNPHSLATELFESLVSLYELIIEDTEVFLADISKIVHTMVQTFLTMIEPEVETANSI